MFIYNIYKGLTVILYSEHFITLQHVEYLTRRPAPDQARRKQCQKIKVRIISLLGLLVTIRESRQPPFSKADWELACYTSAAGGSRKINTTKKHGGEASWLSPAFAVQTWRSGLIPRTHVKEKGENKLQRHSAFHTRAHILSRFAFCCYKNTPTKSNLGRNEFI